MNSTIFGKPSERTLDFIWMKKHGNFLTFTALQDNSSVTFKYDVGSGIRYSKNYGNWTDCPSGTEISLDIDDNVRFVGNGFNSSPINPITMTGSISASGNVGSLNRNSPSPADMCYAYMFQGCTSLVTPPELPSKTLANACYAYMFQGCTSLSAAPELPATELANNCYMGMFENCTSLPHAPELPATELANNCYMGMFENCTSLPHAPELPATELANNCYKHMFHCATGITQVRMSGVFQWDYDENTNGKLAEDHAITILFKEPA